jgi:hypothetical protein
VIRARNRLATVVGLAVAVGVAGICACQEPRERPPRAGCTGANCPITPPFSGGGGSSTVDSGVRDVAADAVATITGTVQAFAGDDFQVKVAFLETAEVRAEAPGGAEVVATYDGTNPFLLEGARLDSRVWITVLPDASPDEAMPTLFLADTTRVDPIIVPLVRGLTLDSIYNVLTLPPTRTEGTGQVVLRFVDDAEPATPLSGVRVALDGAETTIYDTGGSFSEVETQTGPLGLALFANVAAVPLPGTDHTLRIEGVAPGSLKLRIAANTATFAEVRLSP